MTTGKVAKAVKPVVAGLTRKLARRSAPQALTMKATLDQLR